jgi:hypothetical protein
MWGGAAPADHGRGRGDTDEDGFEWDRRCRRAATQILEVEETLGSGNGKGTRREAGCGPGISSIGRMNQRNGELSALAIVGERETREPACATLASDLSESVGGINLVKIAKFKEIYPFDVSLGDALRHVPRNRVLYAVCRHAEAGSIFPFKKNGSYYMKIKKLQMFYLSATAKT